MLKGYKTVLFNILAMAVAVAQYYGGPLPEVDPGQFALVVAIGNIGLRCVTDTGVFSNRRF